MIERKIVEQKIKEFEVEEFVAKNLKGAGHSKTLLQKTPLGEKIIISAAKPGMIVGRKGENINTLTKTLKKKFNLENPQIEIAEVENINLDPKIVAERIANTLENYGSNRFKGAMHRAVEDVISAGALGVEVLISGKIPSSRARTWRAFKGYLKKCGDIAITGIKKAYSTANLKTGAVGIIVSIMTPDVVLPDNITIKKVGDAQVEGGVVEEVTQKEELQEAKKEVEKVPKTDDKKIAKSKEKKPEAKIIKETAKKTIKKAEKKTVKKTVKKK
ncbi:30S ribosomal protein S3 [Candidatus Woesearchaeota archaeon]|nr:30S ribosomal protein S3 [Candidatus Woesearchaeota archaeon]